jgi:hypothetical protein
LLGTQALLHAYQDIECLSPFQKSAAWVGLRQEIRVAFLAQSSVTFPLSCFAVDFSSPPEDGGDWANKMVYHLGDTLNHCCGVLSLTLETHKMLVARGKAWIDMRPTAFDPVFYQKAQVGTRFPVYEYTNDAAGKNLCAGNYS